MSSKSNAGNAPADDTTATMSQIKPAGSDLVPPELFGAPASVKEYAYWVGVTPACPTGGIDLAGINFPKINEFVKPDPLAPGQTQRVPVIGAVVRLTEDRIKLMRDRLPRTIIRFKEAGAENNEAIVFQDVTEGRKPTERKGKVLTIRSKEDVERRRKAGRSTRHYVKNKNDEPAARYMFAVLCTNQEDPRRGGTYPDVLENTGLKWPD